MAEQRMLLACFGQGDAIEGLIQHSEQELAEAKGKRFIRSVEEMRAWDYQQMNEKLWQFLDKLVEKRND